MGSGANLAWHRNFLRPPRKIRPHFRSKVAFPPTYTGDDQTHNLGAVTFHRSGAFDVKNGRTKRDSSFPAISDESLIGEINQRRTTMKSATLVKFVRDPRTGDVHRPSEEVTILNVIHNMDRTLMKVKWQAGGDCVMFPEELAEITSGSVTWMT
jgi:hypothetical protein